MSAIETRYKGYRFRSRLEARWAVYFDDLGIKWEYEKEGYDLSGIGTGPFEADASSAPLPNGSLYLPDFWLSSVSCRRDDRNGLWLEVKGQEPTQREIDLCTALGRMTQTPVVLAVGVPDWRQEGGCRIYQLWPWFDLPMIFVKCSRQTCGHIKVEYPESNYMYCPKCGDHLLHDSPDLMRACEVAKSARFEHGETPKEK